MSDEQPSGGGTAGAVPVSGPGRSADAADAGDASDAVEAGNAGDPVDAADAVDAASPVADGAVRAAKRALRRELLAARSRLSPAALRRVAGPLARRALSLPEIAHARTVAGYVSVGSEPDTSALLTALRDRGVRVLLPVLLPDRDLDWAVYEGPERLRRTALPGLSVLSEPDGPRLGPESVVTVDAVLLPGLAVDHGGVRLGRGGGSYDRALARLAAAGAHPALVVLLHDGEVVPRVPAEPHDRRVTAAVTPGRVWRFDAADRHAGRPDRDAG